MPEERISWKESNLALIGSDLDHKIKQAAAEGEEAWKGKGEEAGLYIWRVEQFRLKEWSEPGKFHTGDSYVILWSYLEEDKLKHDLHIWIGAESSQDEYGTAAYKMVEADDFLGGIAVQHRQVQGKESEEFLSYFDGPLTYLAGGVESGFKHVEPNEAEPHLYKIKGTEKGMSLTQVDLSKSSLNSGDSFILFAGPEKVWVWHGASANPDEKNRANSLGENMCTQGTVVTMDQGDADEEHEDFWGFLGDGEIQEADEKDEEIEEFCPLLFKLTSANEEPEQVAKGEPVKFGFGKSTAKIQKDVLDDSDTFLLDAGWEIFVWVGSGADRTEKLAAFAHADKYAKQDPRTMDLPVSIVKSGWEGSSFNHFFV